MPLYEYRCRGCGETFELLRSVREASQPQSCPACDHDAQRIVPAEFQAFTLRQGLYRKLPDNRTFWHYDQRVSNPVNSAAPAGEHPELRRQKLGPERPPTAEEREAFDHRLAVRLEHEAESLASGRPPIRDLHEERKTKAFVGRVRRTRTQAKEQARRDPNADTTPRTASGTHRKSSGSQKPRG